MDNLGHGGSDVPRVPPASIGNYTLKYHSDVIVELARQLGCNHITLGGHDWVSHYGLCREIMALSMTRS